MDANDASTETKKIYFILFGIPHNDIVVSTTFKSLHRLDVQQFFRIQTNLNGSSECEC